MAFTNRKRAAFTQVLNSMLYDPALTWADKGLLTAMLSFPDDWEYHVSHLATLSVDGEKAIYAAMKRLETAGYLERKQKREPKGKFAEIDYIVSDTTNGISVCRDTGRRQTGRREEESSNTQLTNTQEDKTLAETPPAPQLSLFPGEPDLDQIERRHTEAWEGVSQPEMTLDRAIEVLTDARNSGLKRVEDTEATPPPSSASVPKEMTARNTQKQGYAIEASQRKQYIKTLQEILGEKYYVAESLIKKYGMKPEKLLQKFQSTPAVLAKLLATDAQGILDLFYKAESTAAIYATGYQSNIGWQFFDWLTKQPSLNKVQEAPGKPTPYVIKYTDPDWREKHEAYTRAFEEWQEKNRR